MGFQVAFLLLLFSPCAFAPDWTSGFFTDDMVEPIGSTAVAMPSCSSFETTLCAVESTKVYVVDGAADKLISFYTFDDGLGADHSGNGHHALTPPVAGPPWGPTGGSAAFDGNFMMEVAHTQKMVSSDQSISFWMYLLEDSTNSYRTVFRKGGVSTDLTPALSLFQTTRRLHARLSTSTTVTAGLDSIAVVPLRRWTHVAYVLRGSVLTLYVNGIKDSQKMVDGDPVFNTGPFYIGKDPWMAGTAMYIDEFKMFSKALTEDEVRLEADYAVGTLGPQFMKLGCDSCDKAALEAACPEDYHACLCQELTGGGLAIARYMGWLRGPSRDWDFHIANPTGCPLAAGPDAPTKIGFCCQD